MEGNKKVRKEIGEFRQLMKGVFTCFDPGDLEESSLPPMAHKAKASGLDYIEVTALGEKTQLEAEQVLQIERDINSQIYSRDFLLIEQADMIIGFIPAMSDGRAAV